MKLVTLFLLVFLLTGCGTAIVSPTSPTPRSSPSTSGGVVSLNFDDGCESAYVHGLPIIEAAGFKTTQFIITKRLGEPGFLTTGQLLAMQNSGHEIGAHTRTHPNLSILTAAQQQDEIEGSLTDLEAIGVTPTSFAYPYGAYNDTTLSIVEKAGFLSARGTKRGFNDASANRLLLNGWILGPEGINDLNRITQAIDDAQTNGTWLILIFHRIDETGEATSIPHEMLQEIVDHLVEQKTNVVATREALNIYGLK